MTADLIPTIQPVYDGPRVPSAPSLGVQRIYLLPNGYAVSVIRGKLAYAGVDTWELAVYRVTETCEPVRDSDEVWEHIGVRSSMACYHTSVGTFIGWQTEDEVREHLAVLAALPDDHDCLNPKRIDGEVISVVDIEDWSV